MVTICRHGQTEWNKAGRLQGHMDSPLTQEWKMTAIAIWNILSAEWSPISTIHSSPLPRAHDTSKIIANTLWKPTPVIELHDELREMSFWTHEWLTREQRDPQEIALRDADPLWTPLPDWESYSDLQVRIEDFRSGTELWTNEVIVAHEALNRTLIWALVWLSDGDMMQISQPNSVIYRVINGKLYHNTIGNDDGWIEWIYTQK